VAAERVRPREARHVDVVLNDHDVAHGVAAVEPPRCVRHDHGFHAQQGEDSQRVRHLQAQTL